MQAFRDEKNSDTSLSRISIFQSPLNIFTILFSWTACRPQPLSLPHRRLPQCCHIWRKFQCKTFLSLTLFAYPIIPGVYAPTAMPNFVFTLRYRRLAASGLLQRGASNAETNLERREIPSMPESSPKPYGSPLEWLSEKKLKGVSLNICHIRYNRVIFQGASIHLY